MKRYMFNIAFVFALVFWTGCGIIAGFYGTELGLLFVGKAKDIAKFRRMKEIRDLKRELQITHQTLCGGTVALVTYFLWNRATYIRWLSQSITITLLFTGTTLYVRRSMVTRYVAYRSDLRLNELTGAI